jgi:hypothetical protein
VEIEAMLAALIALWCKGSSVAVRAKEDLKSTLRDNIKDIKLLEDALSNDSTPGATITTRKVIDVDKPSKVLEREHTVHDIDISDRRTLYPLLARLQLPPATVFVPSACPGLSGPFDSTLK